MIKSNTLIKRVQQKEMFAKGVKREKGKKKVLRIGKPHVTPAWIGKEYGMAKTREPLGLHLKPKAKGGRSWRQKHEGNCDERISHAQNAQISSGAARFSADLTPVYMG